MNTIKFKSIGTISFCPFKDLEGMPIQPIGARGINGEININPEYNGGLKDLEGFSHIILIYHLHLSKGHLLEVKPFLNTKKGVYSLQEPQKDSNPIGLSVVKLEKIEGNTIYISNVDMVDGTPLLDIKPYIPHFDKHPNDDVIIGWFEDKYTDASSKKSDGRFKE